MKTNKRNISIVIVVAIIMVLSQLFATRVHATIPGITVTVSSNPASGTEVQTGDQITYTITITNNGSTDYALPMLLTFIPTGTTYVDGSATGLSASFDEPTGTLAIANAELSVGETMVFKFTVKVTAEAGATIEYANKSGSEETADGAVMYFLYDKSLLGLSEDEMNQEFDNVWDVIVASDNIDDANTQLNGMAVIDIVQQTQTHTVVAADTTTTDTTDTNTTDNTTNTTDTNTTNNTTTDTNTITQTNTTTNNTQGSSKTNTTTKKLDNEPNTGVTDYAPFAGVTALISLAGIAILKFKKM